MMVTLLLTGCFGCGLLINEMRNPSLPLVYLTPEHRLNDVIQEMAASGAAPTGSIEDHQLAPNSSIPIANARPPSPVASPMVELKPEYLLNDVVQAMSASSTAPVSLEPEVNLKEMHQIVTDHSALILDARPRSLFQAGHLPSAESLPRDDFKRWYQVLENQLDSHRDKAIVVYCSSHDCPDSQLVAEALRKLGYKNLRVFRGGWKEWEGANFPKAKGCGC